MVFTVMFVLLRIFLYIFQNDFGKINPKLGPAIPPYNAHFDRFARNYFSFKGLKKNLVKTGQVNKFFFFFNNLFILTTLLTLS